MAAAERIYPATSPAKMIKQGDSLLTVIEFTVTNPAMLIALAALELLALS